MSTLLPAQASNGLATAFQEAGVHLHLNKTLESIDDKQATLSCGTTLSYDLCLSAVGLTPNTALAEQGGLNTDRGIVCDTLLQTSAENIYAIGDCAQIGEPNGLNLLYVLPLMTQARALANTLTGTPSEVSYPAMPVTVKTSLYPIVTYNPPNQSEGSKWVMIEETDEQQEFHLLNDKEELIGFCLCGTATSKRSTLAKSCPKLL